MKFTRMIACAIGLAAVCARMDAKKTDSNLDFKLSSALSVPSGFSEPSISEDGSLVYVFMQNIPGFPIAQIYQNINGTLVLSKSINTDPLFPFSWDGYASKDFTRFSVIDIPSVTPPFMARIRILDANLNTLASQPFTGDFVPFINGGQFSPDGKYVTFGYSQFTSPTTTNTVFMILRTSDLSTFVTATLPGFDINASPLFEVNGKLYLAYQETNGVPGDINQPVQLPINSSVYRVDETGITLVDSQPIPKFAETDVVSYGKCALIAHGGFCSLFPNQLSIYNTNDGLTTYQPNDNAEARVFKFDGKKLKLIVKEPVNCCNRTRTYPPDKGRTYFLGQNTEVGNPPHRVIDREFFCFAKLVETKQGLKFKGENLPQQDTFQAIPVFSRDGKWLLRTGTYGYADGITPSLDANGIHNILLYKVVDFCND